MKPLSDNSNLLTGLKILVVEDDNDLRDSIVDGLKLFGADTFEAENGISALEVLKQKEREIDFILSDIRMPGGDGVEFLRAVRQRNSIHPPFFFLSGYSDLNPDDAVEMGAQAMFAKPYNFVELAKSIHTAAKSSIAS